MSRGINKVILVGNLGGDIELKKTANGFPVANATLATSSMQKEKEVTEWPRIVLLGKLAENAAAFTKKGSKVYIEGKLQTRKWQDKSGADRYTTEIVAYDMQFLDKKDGGQGAQQAQDAAPEFVDDDIPF